MGPITSLYFVLKIENPQRFKRTRDIGAFVGSASQARSKRGNRQRVAHQQMRRPLSAPPTRWALPSISWDLSGQKARCVTTGYGWPRMAPQKPRSGPLLLWPASSPCSCSRSGSSVNPTKLFRIMAHRSSDGGYAPPNPAPLVAAGVRGELLSATGGRTIRKDCGRTLGAPPETSKPTEQPSAFAALNGSKHGPKYQVLDASPSPHRRKQNLHEDESSNLLTAFSWKTSRESSTTSAAQRLKRAMQNSRRDQKVS